MNLRNLLFVVAVLTVACGSSTPTNHQAEEPVQLPNGAVEMKYNRHLYFEVVLRDSIPARMIFDTGATNLLLDSAFYAANFGKSGNLRRAMLGGAGDGYQQTTLDASRWSYRVGAVSHTEPMAIVVNLRKILGDGADGLFGLPFMMGRRVEFNYADGYMRILPPEEQIATDFTAIACKWLKDKDRIILPLSLTFANGYRLDGNFLMDTGMPDELSLNSATANRLKAQGALADARRMKYQVGGIGGSRVDNCIKTKQITIGGKAINDIRITYSENEQGAMADSRYDGLVGNALFARFDLIVDFEKWVIYLRPNNNFDTPQPNNFGIALRPNSDHWVVNGLMEGGNAEKAGLRHGDRIEKINGLRADQVDGVAYDAHSDKLTLSVLRGGALVEIVVGKE